MGKRLATDQERAVVIEPLFNIAATLWAIASMGNELADCASYPQDTGDALARLAAQARAQLVDVIKHLDP